MWHLVDLAQQRNVTLAQLKEAPGLDVAVEEALGYQGPRVNFSHFAFVLEKGYERLGDLSGSLVPLQPSITCRTGFVTRYFSKNALGDMS
jgi:hypothetical protein